MRRQRRRLLLIAANGAGVLALLGVGGWDVFQLYTGIGLPQRAGAPLELVAHRGDLDRWPENTLEAITAAAELPIDGIEFDVIASADGTWWVIHDVILDRTTDGSGLVHETRDSALAALHIDGGIGFERARHRALAVPRLVDVLEALRDFGGTIYVDVQHAPAGDLAEVVELLHGRSAAILCRSLDDARLVKEHNSAIKTYLRQQAGPANEHVDGWLMEAFFEADVGAVQGTELPVITFVDEWRASQGEEQLIRRAWAIGVAAFLTKQPSAAIDTRARLAADTSE